MKVKPKNIQIIKENFREFLGNLSVEEIILNRPLMERVTKIHNMLAKL